jgi:hypothetical protein
MEILLKIFPCPIDLSSLETMRVLQIDIALKNKLANEWCLYHVVVFLDLITYKLNVNVYEKIMYWAKETLMGG